MTDEQKVFILGVEGRGDEVIKTLTDLGANNLGEMDGENTHAVYFITHNGIVGYTDSDEIVSMLMEYCHEVKLPEQWKDGDVLINLEGDTFVVFCNDIPDFSFRACLQVYEGVCQEYPSGLICYRNKYRLATPAEVDKFQDILKKQGKHWNQETKELEDAEVRLTDAEMMETLRRVISTNTVIGTLDKQDYGTEEAGKATIEQLTDYDTLYFYVTSVGDVQAAVVRNIIDRTRFRIGNFFHTREEANGMAEKVKNLMKGGNE